MIVINNKSEYFIELLGRISEKLILIGQCNDNHDMCLLSMAEIEIEHDINIDKDKTIEFMESNHGYNDSEILMNVGSLI